jgi:hypothetical protein
MPGFPEHMDKSLFLFFYKKEAASRLPRFHFRPVNDSQEAYGKRKARGGKRRTAAVGGE